MAKFTKIVAQYKRMQAELNNDEAENVESLSDNYHEVLRLKKINQHLEMKINRLYNMLGGDDSELVLREKLCDDKAKKILEAINKLKQAKKEITQLIDNTYGKISESERKERALLEEIRKLREENSRLHKKIQQLHEDNPYIFSESENSYKENLYRENSYKEEAQKTSSKLSTSMFEISRPKDAKTEQRLDNIESKVDSLSDQISQIHEYLKMLSHPSSAHLVEDSIYNQLEEFLES